MSELEIVALLHAWRAKKAELKQLHAAMVRVAVDICGLSEAAALKANLPDLIEGYLTGLGHMPAHRVERLRKAAA